MLSAMKLKLDCRPPVIDFVQTPYSILELFSVDFLFN